jgi:hypothetical protein
MEINFFINTGVFGKLGGLKIFLGGFAELRK